MSLATVFVINSQTLKIQRNPRRRRSIIRQFALTTSAHGIPGIARSQ
ncbi:unnamed protein product, partial [Adineta steineri]